MIIIPWGSPWWMVQVHSGVQWLMVLTQSHQGGLSMLWRAGDHVTHIHATSLQQLLFGHSLAVQGEAQVLVGWPLGAPRP